MPFLLLDDATQEAQRRLQEYGSGLLTNLQQANQPPLQNVSADDVTSRLQAFGTQQLQQLQQLNQPPFPGAFGTTPGAPPPVPGVQLPTPPQQLQQLNQPPLQQLQPEGLQDITQRLQDFGTQQLQGAQQQVQQLNQPPFAGVQQPLEPFAQPGGDLQDYARQAANRAGIDPDIFLKQIQQESGFNPGARSPAGAIGVAQFMPDTARGLGVDPTDPYASLNGAAQLMASNLQKYGGDYAKALAAYNAGPGNVDKYGGVPPFEETQRYVNTILGGSPLLKPPPGNTGGQSLSAPNSQSTSGGPSGQQWLQIAEAQLSKPYIWGSLGGRSDMGQDPAGFDCSGFVSYVMKTGFGINLPAFTGTAYQQTRALGPNEQPRPGDVVFYNMDSGDPHEQHIALYIGNGQIIQAGGTRRDVNIASADQPVGSAPEYRRPTALDNDAGNALAQNVVGGIAQTASNASQAASQTAQDVSQKAQQAWTLLGQAPEAARGFVAPAMSAFDQGLTDVAMNNPLMGAIRNERNIGPAVSDALQQPLSDLGQAIRQTPASPFLLPGTTNVGPTLGDVLDLKSQVFPSILDPGHPMNQYQYLQDKYGGLNAPDMTPEDQKIADNVSLFIGGMTMGENPGTVADLATALRQYPEEVKAGLRTFVQEQTQAGMSGKQINDTLRQWVSENPLESLTRPTETPVAAPSGGPPAAPPPLEALTTRTPAPPPEPPVAGPVRAAPPAPGIVGRVLGAPGAAVSRFGSLIASALEPTANLPAETAGVIKNYANMVGRQSDAARVLAENEMRGAGANLSIPAVADQVTQRMYELQDQAARTLVDNLQAQGKAAPIRNAPREFRTVTDNPNTYLANYAFSPDVVPAIKAVTDVGQIASNPLGSAVLKTIGTAKGTLFSLSNFHTLTEALNSAFTSPQTLKNFIGAFGSDTFAQGLRGSMADTIDAAAQAGVTGLAEHTRPEDAGAQLGNALWRRVVAGGVSGTGGAAAGYTETKLTGGTEEEARANALKGGTAGLLLAGVPLGSRGTVPEILQSALWDRAVPLAKATAWDALTKGGLDPQAAAQVVNERFGGLNYAAMGRNPTLVDAQRLLLQASDWNEATVRQLGSAMFGGTGQGVRAGFLAKTIAGVMTATEVANYALSGHSTLQNQPGHQFEVEVQNPNGGMLHFGLLPGNVQAYLNLANTEFSDPKKRGTQPVNFIVNRLSAPVGAGIDAALTASGKPPFQVAKAGPIAYGENFAPIGVSQVLQSTLQGGMNPLAAAGLAALGLNPRYTAGGGGAGGFSSPATALPTSRASALPSQATSLPSQSYAPLPSR